MTARMLENAGFDEEAVRDLCLARLACSHPAGCSLKVFGEDLYDLIGYDLRRNSWPKRVEKMMAELETGGFVVEVENTGSGGGAPHSGRYVLTQAGQFRVEQFLPYRALSGRSWHDVKISDLTAKALDLQSPSGKILNGLKSIDGLRGVILKRHYHLPIRADIPSIAQLRSALSVYALEKTYEVPLAQKFGMGNRVSEKLGLFLVSRLLKRPRYVKSFSKLLSLLTAQSVEAEKSDANHLRQNVLRRLVRNEESEGQGGEAKDLQDFACAVNKIAQNMATGWPGRKRAYISHVWQVLQDEKTIWKMSENEFKTKLADAHRAGHLSLTIADLRDRENIADVQASQTKYKNSEWHLIRVEE